MGADQIGGAYWAVGTFEEMAYLETKKHSAWQREKNEYIESIWKEAGRKNVTLVEMKNLKERLKQKITDAIDHLKCEESLLPGKPLKKFQAATE